MEVTVGSLWGALQEFAARNPEIPALLEPHGCVVSYGQLARTMDALGDMLSELGLGAADTVAVVLEDGLAGLMALLGAAQFCACSPINPALTAAELEADLLEVTAAAVILSGADEGTRVVADRLGLICIEATLTSYGCRWRCQGTAARRRGPRANRRDHGGATLLLHTSATTGRRKVVPLSAANVQAVLRNSVRLLELGPEDRVLMMARLFHTQGILSPFTQLLAGGSVIVMDGFTPLGFRTCLEELQPTWYTCGPTLHRNILAHLRQQPLSRPTGLRFIRSGGAPLPPALRCELEQVLRVPVLDVYGLTEVGAVACTTPEMYREGVVTAESTSVGRSMGPEIAVLSAEGGVLAAGAEGEVAVAGPTVMEGYLNDPAANQEAFRGRWFRTGDLGWVDSGGFLHITGRLKEMVNRGGQKIVPSEIDGVLMTHEAVREVAAFAVPHATLGEDIACAVVLRDGTTVSASELRSFAAQQLAAFKVPRRIYFLDKIPYGATGKPQRLLLRERVAELEAREAEARALQEADAAGAEPLQDGQRTHEPEPRDFGRELAQMWCRYLGVNEAGTEQDFFAAGGDSLAAVNLLMEVEEVLGLKGPLSQARFFERPTLANISELAVEALAGGTGAAPSSAIEVVPVKGGSGPIPMFMIPADGDEGSYFRRLARRLGAEWPVALVRPGNSWHRPSLYGIEEAGRETVAAIRAARPRGPYVIGGFCYGGVVAFEAAGQLERAGERVGLLLFDVPMPGSPGLARGWHLYVRLGAEKARLAWKRRRREPFTSFVRMVVIRGLWRILRRARPEAGTLAPGSRLHRISETVRVEYFPLYRPGPIMGPVVHFKAETQEDQLRMEALEGWQSVCRGGVTSVWLRGGHHAVLAEDNLGETCERMTAWITEHLQRESEMAGLSR